MHVSKPCIAVGALLLATASSGLSAREGGWSGLKADWKDRGITVTGLQITEVGHNFQGGTRKVTRAPGQFSLTGSFDAAKLWGIEGGTFQVSVSNRHGNSLDADGGLGLLQPPHSVYGRGEMWRLSQLFWEQKIGRTKIKFGRMTVGEDFAWTPCNFQNLTLCGPGPSQIVGTYLYNYPVSSWGIRVRQELAPEWHLNLGVYESNPLNLDSDRGFYLGFGGATGTIYASELQWTPKFGDGTLPGTWKVGVWADTSDANDIVLDTQGGYTAATGLAPARHDGHWGYSANVLQTLKAGDADGAGEWNMVFNLSVADRDTNRLRSKAAVGAWRTGLIPGRPRDDIGIGIGRTVVNDRVTDQQAYLNDTGARSGALQKAEIVKELYYSVRVNDHLTVRPNIQHISHPGGRSDRESVSIAGLKMLFAF